MTVFSTLPPKEDRYFEDYKEGETYDLGSTPVDEAEVIAFAQRFDPQYFHIDPEAAKHGPFGRLAASGWHTGALMMRMLVDNYISPHGLGGAGLDELRWVKPVYPGDVLHARITITEARVSRSKPDRGVVSTATEVFNQDGQLVMTTRSAGMVLRRPTG